MYNLCLTFQRTTFTTQCCRCGSLNKYFIYRTRTVAAIVGKCKETSDHFHAEENIYCSTSLENYGEYVIQMNFATAIILLFLYNKRELQKL